MAVESARRERAGSPVQDAVVARKRHRRLLFLCALVSVLTTVGILVALAAADDRVLRGGPVPDYFFGTNWAPLFKPSSFGVLPLVVGTLSTTFWACVVALPFGLGAAIYLSEYAHERSRRWPEAGARGPGRYPTVVYGYFALTYVTPHLQDIGLPVEVFNALAAGLVMGVMILPTVASLSDDAMAAVPHGAPRGRLGLGATKLQVSTRVVVPAALSGIVASFVLGISRALGETMIVADRGRLAAQPQPHPLRGDPDDDGLHRLRRESATSRPAASSTRRSSPSGATLFVATFIMNLIAIRLVRRYREIYE